MKAKRKSNELNPLFVSSTEIHSPLIVLPSVPEKERFPLFRILTLLIIILNIVVSLPFLTRSADSTSLLSSQFYLTNYSAVIWILPITFLLFGIVQLIPRTYTNTGYDKLFRPIAFTFILQSTWLNFYSSQAVPDLIFLGGTLVSSILLLNLVHRELAASSIRSFLQIPFGLYTGCLSLLMISHTSNWLYATGWTGGEMSESFFMISMMGFTAVLATYMAFAKNDFAFPAVIAWCDIMFWTEYCQSSYSISVIALSLGIYMIWCSLVTVILSSNVSKISLKPSYEIEISSAEFK